MSAVCPLASKASREDTVRDGGSETSKIADCRKCMKTHVDFLRGDRHGPG